MLSPVPETLLRANSLQALLMEISVAENNIEAIQLAVQGFLAEAETFRDEAEGFSEAAEAALVLVQAIADAIDELIVEQNGLTIEQLAKINSLPTDPGSVLTGLAAQIQYLLDALNGYYQVPDTGIPLTDLSAAVQAQLAGTGGTGFVEIAHGTDVDTLRNYSTGEVIPDLVPVRWIGMVYPNNFSQVDGRDTLVLVRPIGPAEPVPTPYSGGVAVFSPLVPGCTRRRFSITNSLGVLVSSVVTDITDDSVNITGLPEESLFVSVEHGVVYTVPSPTQDVLGRRTEVVNYSIPSVIVSFAQVETLPRVVINTPVADETLPQDVLVAIWESVLGDETELSVTLTLYKR